MGVGERRPEQDLVGAHPPEAGGVSAVMLPGMGPGLGTPPETSWETEPGTHTGPVRHQQAQTGFLSPDLRLWLVPRTQVPAWPSRCSGRRYAVSLLPGTSGFGFRASAVGVGTCGPPALSPCPSGGVLLRLRGPQHSPHCPCAHVPGSLRECGRGKGGMCAFGQKMVLFSLDNL